MANYDEQRGAWTDYSGGVHNTEQDALNSNSRLMGDRDGSSTSSYNSVDLNSPEYNRKYPDYSSSSLLTSEDYAQIAQQYADIVQRPINMALDLEKEAYDCMMKRDSKGAAEAFMTVYDILAAPNWSDYYNAYYGKYPHLNPEVWDSIYADRDEFFVKAGMQHRGFATEQADKGNYDAAIYHISEAVVLSSGEMRDNYLNLLGSYLYERGGLYDKKNLSEKAIVDYKKAASCNKDWAKFAVKKLAKKGIQYTPKSINVVERTTPPWITDMIAKSISKLTGSGAISYSTSPAATQSAAGEKKGGIVSGIVLGVICGFLGIIGIGGLMIIATGDAGWKMETRNFFIGLAVLAAIFTLVWRKRKWLWVVLLFALAAFGGYVLVGAPGLDGAMTETVQPAAATVTAGTLNLRAEPSTTGAVVEKLNRGDRLTLAGGQANGWLEVEYNGKKGYVDAKYVTVE